MFRSFFLSIVLTLVWGMNWPVMKIGASELPPLWFRCFGLFIGVAILGAMLALRGRSLRPPPGALGRIVVLSIPNVMIWYSFATIAVTLLPAGRAAMLGFTMPAWSALIGVVFFRERLDARVVFGVACAVVGVLLLVAGDWRTLAGHPLGVSMMLVAAVAWAWGTHAYRRARLDMDTLVLTFWMMAVAFPVLLAASAVFEGARWRMPAGVEWWPILYNAILVLAIGNLIWFTVARTLPPTTAGLSTMLIPVVGVFSGMVLLGEVPPWRDFVALALICIAVAAALIPTPAPAGAP